jgi:cell division protein FtsB
MAVKLSLREMLARSVLPVCCAVVAGYFAWHALSGPTGFSAWRDYQAQRARLEQQVQSAQEQKAALQQRLTLLNPRGVDPDLADELVRRNLDMVRPDEVIVPLPPEPSPAN